MTDVKAGNDDAGAVNRSRAPWRDPEVAVLDVASNTWGGLSATPSEDWYRGGS